MRILKLYILFVAASIVFGVGKAFNTNLEDFDIEKIYESNLTIESNASIHVKENKIIILNNEEKKVDVKNQNSNKNATKQSKSNNTKKNQSKNKKSQNQNNSSVSEKNKVDEPKEEHKLECNDFYESITHGKVDRTSKSACVSYGNIIQNNELDAVLDYNEEHGNVKKPTISYFRCYEVVDKNCNTKGWYLHFFCNSNECDDKKLKSLYG